MWFLDVASQSKCACFLSNKPSLIDDALSPVCRPDDLCVHSEEGLFGLAFGGSERKG